MVSNTLKKRLNDLSRKLMPTEEEIFVFSDPRSSVTFRGKEYTVEEAQQAFPRGVIVILSDVDKFDEWERERLDFYARIPENGPKS